MPPGRPPKLHQDQNVDGQGNGHKNRCQHGIGSPQQWNALIMWAMWVSKCSTKDIYNKVETPIPHTHTHTDIYIYTHTSDICPSYICHIYLIKLILPSPRVQPLNMQSLQGRSAAHEAKVLEAAGVNVTGCHRYPRAHTPGVSQNQATGCKLARFQ
jgi:hypothetical protein